MRYFDFCYNFSFAIQNLKCVVEKNEVPLMELKKAGKKVLRAYVVAFSPSTLKDYAKEVFMRGPVKTFEMGLDESVRGIGAANGEEA